MISEFLRARFGLLDVYHEDVKNGKLPLAENRKDCRIALL
jgi:hypothetical protein